MEPKSRMILEIWCSGGDGRSTFSEYVRCGNAKSLADAHSDRWWAWVNSKPTFRVVWRSPTSRLTSFHAGCLGETDRLGGGQHAKTSSDSFASRIHGQCDTRKRETMLSTSLSGGKKNGELSCGRSGRTAEGPPPHRKATKRPGTCTTRSLGWCWRRIDEIEKRIADAPPMHSTAPLMRGQI